ncbi:hypothetical protein DRH27_05200 [Candidatus Falkowbacteria bacterium]|nr:MAG: hypothetical protein DRH27_05200 [Candidatus Falkowbacteria bacterium]
MPISARPKTSLTVNDFLTDDLSSVRSSIVIDGANRDYFFDAETTPPGTLVVHGELEAGAPSVLDFTAAPSTNGIIVDATGLKIYALILTAREANVSIVSVSMSAADEIDSFGILQPKFGPGDSQQYLTEIVGSAIGARQFLRATGDAGDYIDFVAILGA